MEMKVRGFFSPNSISHLQKDMKKRQFPNKKRNLPFMKFFQRLPEMTLHYENKIFMGYYIKTL